MRGLPSGPLLGNGVHIVIKAHLQSGGGGPLVVLAIICVHPGLSVAGTDIHRLDPVRFRIRKIHIPLIHAYVHAPHLLPGHRADGQRGRT